MKYSFFLILVTTYVQVFAQHDTTLSFVEHAIRSRKDVGKIVYLDSSIMFNQPFRHFMKKGRVQGLIGETNVSMKFTKREVRDIDRAFEKTGIVCWHDTLFANSVRVNQDTLLLLNKSLVSNTYFKQQFGRKYFLFSQPVYVRNGTVVIFRVAEMYGPSSGYDLLYIYSRDQNKWQQRMHIYAGAW